MKKVLYIAANSKPENLSASKTVGRAVVDRIRDNYPDYEIEELDLYEADIPRPRYSHFAGRSRLVGDEALRSLTAKEQSEVREMTRLCDQFVGASAYVLAAPMWSLSFPGILKDYLDCIVQTGKTITFDPDDQRPRGLLDDRERSFLYVQSSGGNIPWLARPALNKGLNYVEDLMKFIGIRHVETLLVDDTGTTAEEGRHAIEKAKDKIETVLERLELRGRVVAGVLGDSGTQRL